jgi:hypothetical protein
LQNFGAGISGYFDLGVIVQPCSARFWNIGIFHGIYNIIQPSIFSDAPCMEYLPTFALKITQFFR